MKTLLKILFTRSLWNPPYDYNMQWDLKLNKLMDNYRGEISLDPHVPNIVFGNYEVHSKHGYLMMSNRGDVVGYSKFNHRPSRKTLIALRERVKKLKEEQIDIYYIHV